MEYSQNDIVEKSVVCGRCGAVYPGNVTECFRCHAPLKAAGELARAKADGVWLLLTAGVFLLFFVLELFMPTTAMVVVLCLFGVLLLAGVFFLRNALLDTILQQYEQTVLRDGSMAAVFAQRGELWRRMKAALDAGDLKQYAQLAERTSGFNSDPSFVFLGLYAAALGGDFAGVAPEMERAMQSAGSRELTAEYLGLMDRMTASDSPLEPEGLMTRFSLIEGGAYPNLLHFLAEKSLALPGADIRIYRSACRHFPDIRFRRKLFELLSRDSANPADLVNMGRFLWDAYSGDKEFVGLLAKAVNAAGRQDEFAKAVLDKHNSQ